MRNALEIGRESKEGGTRKRGKKPCAAIGRRN
jgi:hypothetical protein